MSDTQTSEWIEHDGKGMPVAPDTVVEVKLADGRIGFKWPAWQWGRDGEDSNWNNTHPSQANIIAYRVVKP